MHSYEHVEAGGDRNMVRMMDTRMKAVVNQLAFALNQAQCSIAELSGEIAVRDEKISELEARVKELESEQES